MSVDQSFRVLVVGAKGQLGHELIRLSPKNVVVRGTSSSDLNIIDAVAVDKVVEAFKPDLIINAAAYTAVDKAESEVELAYAVNRDGVANLASSAFKNKIPVFHISTDYVFSGDADKPYREEDPTGPTGVYGASKLAGEQVLLAECPTSLILRISWVFGAQGNNFVKTMLRVGSVRSEISVVNDQHGCPTSATSVAHILWQLVSCYREDNQFQWGIYHYSGSPACTWYDFAVEIFRQAQQLGILKERPVVKAIETRQYPTPARRPSWSVLNGEKLKALYGVSSTDWKTDLSGVLQEIKL